MLMNNFIKHGKMETTLAKAKETRPKIEKMVTRAQKDNLANRRFLLRYLSPMIVKKMMGEIGPRYATRKGGYTRIIKLVPRKGDAADKAIIEFV